jgi:hypothetical protein
VSTAVPKACRRAGRFPSSHALRIALPTALLLVTTFSVTAMTPCICAELGGPLDPTRPDTTAWGGQHLGVYAGNSLGAPAANIGYPLDPIPVVADSQWWDGFSRPGVWGIVRAMTLFEGDLAPWAEISHQPAK